MRQSPGPAEIAIPSLAFEEAQQKLPTDGTKDLPITWYLQGAPDTDEILAARQSLAYSYWLNQATDWTLIIPVGRFVYTEAYYEKLLAPYATTSAAENPLIGPIWVKVMGVEQTGTDQATVTFCTDLGYWRHTEDKPQVRKDRANLESYVLANVDSGDGERHWLTDRRIDNDGDRGGPGADGGRPATARRCRSVLPRGPPGRAGGSQSGRHALRDRARGPRCFGP